MAASTDKDDRGKGTPSTEERSFECNICFDTATNAVVSMCGHLFCWPCIHTWMEARPQDTPTCPVCKSVIDKEKLIPLYGRGSDQKDPRESLPPRPAGQREEAPEDNNNTGYFGDGMLNGINISFGMGGFPFGFGLGPAFTIQTGRMGGQHHNVNIGHRGNRMHHGRRGGQEEEQRKTMARLLLTFAILFIIMIIFT